MAWMVGALLGTHWNATNSWLVERRINRGKPPGKYVGRSVPQDRWLYGSSFVAGAIGILAAASQSEHTNTGLGLALGVVAAIAIAVLIVVGLKLMEIRLRATRDGETLVD